MEDWVISSVGKRIYDYTYLGEYKQTLWNFSTVGFKGLGCSEAQVFKEYESFYIGNENIRRRCESRRIINYPPFGIDAISKQLAKSFLEIGGKIIPGAKATAVSIDKDVLVGYISEEGVLFKGDLLISTIPLDELTRMITPGHGRCS